MLFLVDEEKLVLVDVERRPFALKLEHHHTVVVASGEQVDFGVSGNDPESVVFALKALDRSALVQIPNTNRLVLTNGKNQILVGVE